MAYNIIELHLTFSIQRMCFKKLTLLSRLFKLLERKNFKNVKGNLLKKYAFGKIHYGSKME